jgi:chromosome segregation ATPase
MAADNESQGLKIAVAAFVSLTVILAVTSYFLYSNVASAQARLDSARDAEQRAKRTAALALTHYDEMRTRIGTKAEEWDAAKEEISANFKKVEERLASLINVVNAAHKSAEQNGARGRDLEDVKLKVQRAIALYRSEPNRTYISSLERLTDAMENLALLTTQLSLKYSTLQKTLEGGASVPKGQKDQAPKTKDEAPKTTD